MEKLNNQTCMATIDKCVEQIKKIVRIDENQVLVISRQRRLHTHNTENIIIGLTIIFLKLLNGLNMMLTCRRKFRGWEGIFLLQTANT